VHALLKQSACMKRTDMEQLTIRRVPRAVGAHLRERARREGRSLNAVAVEALCRGAGLGTEPVRYADLDDLAGTWSADPAFDKALATMDEVDEESWR
jgi:plasmid stability protein